MFSRRFLCEAEIQPQLKCSTQIILEREAVLSVKPVLNSWEFLGISPCGEGGDGGAAGFGAVITSCGCPGEGGSVRLWLPVLSEIELLTRSESGFKQPRGWLWSRAVMMPIVTSNPCRNIELSSLMLTGPRILQTLRLL